MAEDLALEPGVRRPPAEVVAPQEPRSAYRGRFLVAYATLAVLLAAAGGAAFLLATGERAPGEGWADWRPTGDESGYPVQIADHVAARYVLPSGDQLVGILAGPPQVQDVTVRAVAIQAPGADSADDIRVVETDRSVMYVLCGLGENCSIREGEPTQERHRLLRREALEAALFTLKFVEEAESVIALLPPPASAEAGGTALFFQRSQLERELDLPLARTLTPGAPVAAVPPSEAARIDNLTRPRLYSYEFQQLQDGAALMVLSPVQG